MPGNLTQDFYFEKPQKNTNSNYPRGIMRKGNNNNNNRRGGVSTADNHIREKHYVMEKHYVFDDNHRSPNTYHAKPIFQPKNYQQDFHNYPDKITINKNNHDSISHLEDTAHTTRTSMSFPYVDPENIKDKGTSYELGIDLPGVDPKSVKCVFHEKKVTLGGHRHAASGISTFDKTIYVDVTAIQPDTLTANLAHGVLVLKADKVKSEAPRDIEITSFENEEEAEAAAKKQKEKEEREARNKKRIEELKRKKIKDRREAVIRNNKLKHALPKPDECVSLLIEICSARDLLIADQLGLSDPYVRVALGGKDLHKTKYISQTLNPRYSEKENNKFIWNGKIKQLQDAGGLTFFLLDYDFLSADDPLGDFKVSMDNLVTMNGQAVEFEVTPPSHLRTETESAGFCTIRVTHANAVLRKKYGAVSATRSFWEPPEDEILEYYRQEVLDNEDDDDDNSNDDNKSKKSSSKSLHKDDKRPSQKKVIKKACSSGGGFV